MKEMKNLQLYPNPMTPSPLWEGEKSLSLSWEGFGVGQQDIVCSNKVNQTTTVVVFIHH